ncbi:MAG: hypothetical protein L3V56_14650, partial [Candidatus Magnetoovum sp. WYHC-5]|nr:hypothetical protein [Candidatus Magnetoovum sp. WYHC-5]
MLELYFANMLEEAIGEKGLSLLQIESLRDNIEKAHEQIIKRKWQELAFLDLAAYDTSSIKEIAAEVISTSDYFLLLGIGGSAMGPRVILEALKPLHNYISSPKIFIYDNIDPRTLNAILSIIDASKTSVNVVTKSGTTAETLASFMVLWNKMEKALGKDAAKRFIISTSPAKGMMRELVNEYGFKSLPIPDGIVGRYSVFSSAGLLISEIAGINTTELLSGARDIIQRCQVSELWENPAYVFSALLYLMSVKEGRNINVMMPYADGLKAAAEWFCQLWAESLGKLGFGLTPYPSLGTTDQHSQLQLWLEGPEDKVVIFIHIGDYAVDIKIPNIFEEKERCSCLAGNSLSDLIKAAEEATEVVLSEASKPNMTLYMPHMVSINCGH